MSKSRTHYADQGTCIICGKSTPPAWHATPEAPFTHSACHAFVERLALDPCPGDDTFIARCDAIREKTLAEAGASASRDGARVNAALRERWENRAREAALEDLLFYVPTHIVEDFIMGAL